MVQTIDVRNRLEEREELLAPRATKSRFSRGRLQPEIPSPVRTEFQRDRDRIIHSKAFRRLKYKTQVFIAPQGDHYITRLTHTLQVSQIARTITRALSLNEDLTEAITLGHDLGHPPFGHAGEEALGRLYPGGFRHNVHSVRVVDHLEKNGRGLNLTDEVRDGILNHSKVREGIEAEAWGTPYTLEGQVSKLSDSVAYINHDIGDAIRAGMLTEEDLPRECIEVLGRSHSERINTMVCDIVNRSWEAANAPEPLQQNEAIGSAISMSPEALQATNALREFLFQQVYLSEPVHRETEKAQYIVEMLYTYFVKHPEKMPAEFLNQAEPVERCVVDYIAGMTDRFALQAFDEIYKPRLWVAVP